MLQAFEFERVDENLEKQPLWRVVISGPAADLSLDCDETITIGRVSPITVFVRMSNRNADKINRCEGYSATAVTDEQARVFGQFSAIANDVLGKGN